MSTVFWGFCDKPQKDEKNLLCQALAAAKTEEIKAGTKQIETKKEEKVPRVFLGGVFFFDFSPRIPGENDPIWLAQNAVPRNANVTAMNLVVFHWSPAWRPMLTRSVRLKNKRLRTPRLRSQPELLGRSEMIFLVPVPLEFITIPWMQEWLTEMYLMINLHDYMHIWYVIWIICYTLM